MCILRRGFSESVHDGESENDTAQTHAPYSNPRRRGGKPVQSVRYRNIYRCYTQNGCEHEPKQKQGGVTSFDRRRQGSERHRVEEQMSQVLVKQR